MKKLLLILLLLLAIPVGLAVFGGQLLGKGVEAGGTKALGTETTVGGSSLNLLSGSLGLEDLQIRNPQGFEAKNAFEVSAIEVKTDIGSLMSDTIEIEEIRITYPVITLEVNQKGTNLGALMDKLAQPESSPEESSEGGKKMRIGLLIIESAEVKLVQSLLLKDGLNLTLPTLTMENVGDDVNMAELMEKVLGLILAAVSETQIDGQLKGLLKGKIPGDLKKQLDGVVSDLSKQLEGLGGDLSDKLGDSLGEQLGDSAKDALKGLGDSLGGLLGGDDDDK